ncbi:hypothetical protein BZL30_4055 [Mycobacterium kansasii]|uniref:Uncharacterized protein n=1 Tax=Mycobacterium kansasii TaxID=1768 RepID=A0A1V3X925_MYCKA|nr:hypothetical protein BZL30_4055 [Mycobacterium kansasii]
MPGCGGGGGSAVTGGDVVDGDVGAVGEVLAWLGPALPEVVGGARRRKWWLGMLARM